MEIFDDFTNSLIEGEQAIETSGGRARLDLRREMRKGVPEIIYAEQKMPDDVVEIARRFLSEGRGRVLISRSSQELRNRLRAEVVWVESQGGGHPIHFEEYAASGMMILRRNGVSRPRTGGRVGVITAGTSDVPVAEEAAVVATEMGCNVTTIYDVGVAGLHRLMRPLKQLMKDEVDIIIVAAGMDGALPSVVSGLVDVPVIGLPTSVGYGLGGKGVAALLSMLQTCSPGLTVVNIDNGVGAGATAALTANRMARLRG
ncbi:MAG: nickel pincer cofactor biosynthesis protein LarB [Chloroflexi bacterium]|nr:nickel pincer cofactor biosynthesis protein LarB [Chloroflexota bacterium]